MLAEAVHSTVDTGNELAFVARAEAQPASSRPATSFRARQVPYFYSLLVAVYIFAGGALLTVYQGIWRLRHPQPSLHLGWNYALLALAAAFELYSWRISYPAVEAVGDILTMQMGPEQVLLTVDIRFRRGLDVQQVESAIDRLEARIRQQEPTIERIFIEPDSLKAPAGKSLKTA